MIIVNTLDTDLCGAGLAKVLDHLMRVFWTGDALKIPKEQWHCLFRVYEVDNLLIFPAFFDISFNNRLIIIWALSESFCLQHVSNTCLTKGTSTLM